MARKVILRSPNTRVWDGANLTGDYYDVNVPSGQYGEQAYGGDQTEYGGIRHFRNVDPTA